MLFRSAFKFNQTPLVYFCFYFHYFRTWVIEDLALIYIIEGAIITYTGLGKQTLGGHKQKLVGSRTQEKGAVTPQETDPALPMSVQESPAEAWVGSGLVQGQGH